MKGLSQRLLVSRATALNAGSRLLSLFRKQLTVHKKRRSGYLSEADTITSLMIHSKITTAFPEDAYCCEELGDRGNKDADYQWIVDPLDGTTNFIRGSGEFGVSIALACKGVPVLGVVYAPYWNELFYAAAGNGAWVDDGSGKVQRRLKVAETRAVKMSVIEFPGGIEVPHRAYKELDMIHLFYPSIRLRVSECASLALCRVAAGETDAYIHPTEKPHDFAAGALIVKEAGGVVTSFPDKSLTIKRRGLIASTKGLHCKIVYRLKKRHMAKPEYWLENNK